MSGTWDMQEYRNYEGIGRVIRKHLNAGNSSPLILSQIIKKEF